jgi:predicted transcriptional regulator
MRSKSPGGGGGQFKNRSRLEIITSLLEREEKGALKTHLMYAGNLSYTMLDVYIRFLLDNRLVAVARENGKNQTFTTTAKGKKFIELFHGIQKLAYGNEKVVETSSKEEFAALG